MKRSSARELAFKTIYSKFFNTNENDELEITDRDSLDYISKVLRSFASNYDEINQIISTHLKGYTVERLYKIDLAIIMLAVVELKFMNDAPKEVIINEAVELAKKYSTEKSPRFINGVLADIVK